MLSRLGRDAVIYGGTHFLGRVAAFILLPVYTRVLSPADLGSVDLALAVSAFALVTVSLEVGQGAARLLPEAKHDAEREGYVDTSLTFGLLAYGAFIGLALAATPLVVSAIHRSDALPMVASTATWVVTAGLLAIAQVHLRYGLQPGAYALSNVVYSLVSAAGGALLVVVLRAGPVGILLGQAIAAGAALAVALRFGGWQGRFRLDRERLASMLRFSIPIIPASVAVVASAYVDRFVVGGLLSLGDLGVYAVAIRIAAIVGLLLIALQNAIGPLTYLHHRDPDTPAAIGQLSRYYAAAGAFLVAGFALMGPELVAIVGGPAYSAAGGIIPILASAALVAGYTNLAPGLLIARDTRLVSLVAITGAIATTVLNLGLVPRVGIFGAAIASLSGATIVTAATIWLGQSRYRVPVSGLWTAACASLAALSVVSMALLHPSAGEGLAPRIAGVAFVAMVIIAMSRIRGRQT